MKKFLIILLLTLTFCVSVFCCNAYAELRPWNVLVTITYNGDSFCYDLSQNIFSPNQDRCFFASGKIKWKKYLELTKMQLPTDAVFDYILPNFDKITEHFCYLYKDKIDSCVIFDKNGFIYKKGQDGVQIDKQKLFETMVFSQPNQQIELPLVVEKCKTVQQLKQTTVKKSSFTTNFANSSENRSQNVKLATDCINGTTVGVGQTFSFNQIVGKRTEQNGYKSAKVILDGVYVDGVGGGVCQVSTTLYNALLLAEIVPNACQHTLISNYVLEGFDAMVNDNGADLTFTNTNDYPIYIEGKVVGKSVTFCVYGVANTFDVVRKNVKEVKDFDVVYVTDRQKYPHLIYTDQTQVITNGSKGVKTQSYLEYYQDGKLVQTKLIRKNTYKKVNKVVAQGAQQREQ